MIESEGNITGSEHGHHHACIYVCHYNDVIISTMVSQITSLTIVYSTVYSGIDQRKHQSSASLTFVRGIHWWQVNSPHKGPVTRNMFPFDDVIIATNGAKSRADNGYRTSLAVNHFETDSLQIWHSRIPRQCSENFSAFRELICI